MKDRSPELRIRGSQFWLSRVNPSGTVAPPGGWPAHYDGGGVNVVVWYSTDGTAVGAVEFEVSFEVVQDDDDTDAGGQDFGTATNIADTPATATANYVNKTSPGSISHSNCGSPSSGDACRFRIVRDYDHATNTDDVQLLQVVITEQ